MQDKNINIARKKIDRIDSKILNLIKNRAAIVKFILKRKKFKKEIVDKKRIKIILKKIKSKSLKNKIDPKITQNIWKSMIKSFIEYEQRNFKKK
tara:strand:- start:38 stop:319 length:282 start_codon:yes stop_codon:yes gene_type:complete